MILSAIIVGALVTGFVIANSGIGGPAPKPTAGQVSDLNWSSFTEEGLAYIQRTRDIRIDLSSKAEDALALGLPANGTTVIAPHPEGLEYKFIFNGGGAGYGGDKLIVSELAIVTEDGLITEVIAPIVEVANFRTTITNFQREADLYGWDLSFVDALYEEVGEKTKNGEPFGFTVGPSDLIGVPASATAECDVSGYCLVTYNITPGLR